VVAAPGTRAKRNRRSLRPVRLRRTSRNLLRTCQRQSSRDINADQRAPSRKSAAI
jgi:hypothetical protein